MNFENKSNYNKPLRMHIYIYIEREIECSSFFFLFFTYYNLFTYLMLAYIK